MEISHLSETAAQHLVKKVPTAHASDTAASALSNLLGHRFDALDAIYIVDDDGRLQGLIRLPDLLGAPAMKPLRDLMIDKPLAVHPQEDQERIALQAIHQGVAAVPVVDQSGHLLGVVPPESLIEVLEREHIDDMQRLAGISEETEKARASLEASPLTRLWERIPWLLLGLIGSVLMTLVMAGFAGALERRVAVAFFVPALVYLADAIGTQTETIAVRFLSLQQGHGGALLRLLVGEVFTGLLIGAALGAAAFPAVLLGFGDARLALAVSLATVAGSAMASAIIHFGRRLHLSADRRAVAVPQVLPH
jgi:magnesium transporter